jgi:hypothetical protein
MKQKVIVFETNEIPLKIFQHYQSLRPNSVISHLLKNSLILETLAQDVEYSFLYPSQSWASFNTGSPYNLHQIHWYNDPKPESYPLYWKKLAENGVSVGLVNSLHSSPASSYIENGYYKFVIPDCFAADSFTKPSYYQTFQSLNLRATSQNSRATTLSAPATDALLTILNSLRFGIRTQTLFFGLKLILQIISKQVNKERLRNLQFPLISDIFLKLLNQHQPDLSILFTNHVAANMHRYWYGLFPNDYKVNAYDNSWVNRYSNEIIEAMDLLDQYLSKLVKFSEKNNTILILASSMGQHANQTLPENIQTLRSHDFRLENVRKFLNSLTSQQFKCEVESGMVPQYSLKFLDSYEAEQCFHWIRSSMATLENILLNADLNQDVITLTIVLDPHADYYIANGTKFTYSDLGFIKFKIEDHHSGCHCPEGSLIIFNSKTSMSEGSTIDYLEYAPALLKHFDIAQGDYMLKPTFSI